MAEVQKLGRDIRLRVAIERYDIVESAGGRSGNTLEALKARISLTKSGQHVEYTLRVHHEGKTWTLRKRFAEVAELHDALRRRLPSTPELPAKSAMRQFNSEYIEARKAGLNSYLQDLASRRDALNCREVQQFFGLPEQFAAFRQAHASEPVQTAEVHEAAFGVADFAYDPMEGLLLLGAADASWTSRIDTKITNIKLPWEPAAPNLPTSQMSLWRQSPADLRFDMQFICRYTATISCVVLCPAPEKGFCLCGLSDGTVGYSLIRSEPGMNNSGSTLPLLKHTAPVVALATDDAEQWVISASKDNALMIYDSRRQMIVSEVQTPGATSSMRYSQTQKRLFCGLATGRIVVFDAAILPIQQVCTIPDGAEVGPMTKIAALDYDDCTSTLFSVSREGFKLWAMKNSHSGAWGRCVGQLRATASAPTVVAWAPSSREILSGFATGAIVVFDIESGEATYAFQAHNEAITSILWLDAPRRLLTASNDKTLKIWDFPSLRREPLEDATAFATLPEPTVSMMASRNAAPGFGAQGVTVAQRPHSFNGGGDPLCGRSCGGATSSLRASKEVNNSTPSVSSMARNQGYTEGDSSFGCPLGRPLASNESFAASYAGPGPESPSLAGPLHRDTLSRDPLQAGRLGSDSGARGPPLAVAPSRPAVGSAKPSARAQGDSDDDLAG
eukprot:CAMPEP_0117500314 /NCGR_PEP_ID=MMETSP0784-20121206/22712_1 /TAXON_ID=39447 /ORGANISM="" /LENGTH=672 /DNA_ID=CAMNT_0005295519 /DNA_START=43 /DNA_END=2058 /DNA_ORIENTATION=-